jgi:hypothetical protein
MNEFTFGLNSEPVQSIPSHPIFYINFNILHASTSRSFKWSLSLQFLNEHAFLIYGNHTRSIT